MELPDAFVRHQARIAREMRVVFDGRSLPIYDMMQYALGWQEADGSPAEGGGKGMRPSLTLLTAEALAGPDKAGRALDRAAGGAAAVEFVHSFSLVHDDIQDEDVERHHRPTVWVVWGRAQAINVGDALREMSEHALQRSRAAGVSADAVLSAYALLNHSALEMIEGQYMDLSFEERTTVGVDEYLTMIAKKTGAMLGCSMAMAALLVQEDEAAAESLREAGRRLGLCFQMRDDWLGIWGNSMATGKSSDNDVRRRKKSYPIVYAFERTSGATRERLETIYAQESLSDAEVEEVLAVLAEVGAREATEAAAAEQHDAFQQALSHLALEPEALAAFDEVAEFILRRDH